MIEWRFGLTPLTNRDGTANNLADVLNLAAPDVSAPVFTVPAGPFGAACAPLANDPEAAEWAENLQQLRALALKYGFQGVQ